MGLFKRKKMEYTDMPLGDWIARQDADGLINLCIAGQMLGDVDFVAAVMDEIYTRDEWFSITSEIYNELFESELINKVQFMLFKVSDELYLRELESDDDIVAHLYNIGNLENSIRMIVAKYYNPKTMGEPLTNEDVKHLADEILRMRAETS